MNDDRNAAANVLTRKLLTFYSLDTGFLYVHIINKRAFVSHNYRNLLEYKNDVSNKFQYISYQTYHSIAS